MVAGAEDKAPRGTPGTVRVPRKDSMSAPGAGWLVDPGLWHQHPVFCFLKPPMLASVQVHAEPQIQA